MQILEDDIQITETLTKSFCLMPKTQSSTDYILCQVFGRSFPHQVDCVAIFL